MDAEQARTFLLTLPHVVETEQWGHNLVARIHWIAAERWTVFRTSEWQEELRAAHAIIMAKLPPKVREALALPPKELKRRVAERTAILAAKKKR